MFFRVIDDIFFVFSSTKGAPEGLLDRCTHARVQGNKIPMSPAIKNEIMKHVKSYGTGEPLFLTTLLTLQHMNYSKYILSYGYLIGFLYLQDVTHSGVLLWPPLITHQGERIWTWKTPENSFSMR